MMTSSPNSRINLDDVPDGAEIDFEALSRSIRTGSGRSTPSLRKAILHAGIATAAVLSALLLVYGTIRGAKQLTRNESPAAVVTRFLALTRDGDVQSARALCVPTVAVSVRDFERPEILSTKTTNLTHCVTVFKRLHERHKAREKSLGPFWPYILDLTRQNHIHLKEIQLLIALDAQSPTSILEHPDLHAEIAEVRVRASLKRRTDSYYRRGDFVFGLAREKGKGEWKVLSIR